MSKNKDRIYEMDYFLKFCAYNYSNPNDFDVYGLLTRYDVPYEEIINRDVSDKFASWQKYFLFKNNIKVSSLQGHFLNFFTTLGIKNECYKLYLHIPKDNLDECVKLIFDYICSKEYPHESKVGDMVRSDGIVIRVESKEALNDIVEFINNKKKITKCARRTNPFIIRKGVVGLSYDECLSYNSTIASLISDYLKGKYEKKELNTVDIDDFKIFALDYYNKYFTTDDGILKFQKKPIFVDRLYRYSFYERNKYKIELLLNYERVYRVFLMSLSGEKKYRDLIDVISDFGDKTSQEAGKKYLEDLIKKQNLSEVNNLLKEYISLAIPKYGLDKTIEKLSSYADTCNYNFITREDGFRGKFENSCVLSYLKSNSVKDIVIGIYRNIIIDCVNKYIDTVYPKYGINTVILQLETFFREGNYELITRQDDLRNLFEKYNLNNMKKYLVIDIETYVDQYISLKYVNENKTK